MMEVTEWSKEQIKYPVGRKSRLTGAVVIFFSEHHGVVIDPGLEKLGQGESSSTWFSCNKSEDWEPVNITITC